MEICRRSDAHWRFVRNRRGEDGALKAARFFGSQEGGLPRELQPFSKNLVPSLVKATISLGGLRQNTPEQKRTVSENDLLCYITSVVLGTRPSLPRFREKNFEDAHREQLQETYPLFYRATFRRNGRRSR